MRLGSFVLFHFQFIEIAFFLDLILFYNHVEYLHDSKIKSIKQGIFKEV